MNTFEPFDNYVMVELETLLVLYIISLTLTIPNCTFEGLVNAQVKLFKIVFTVFQGNNCVTFDVTIHLSI